MDTEHDVRKGVLHKSSSCEYCPQMFYSKSDLMCHKKYEHKDKVNPCKYFQEDRCMFSDEVCWNSHLVNQKLIITTTKNEYICKYCDQVFMSKTELMKHRKHKHIQYVALCRHKTNDKCKYNNNCWFKHDAEKIECQVESNYSPN